MKNKVTLSKQALLILGVSEKDMFIYTTLLALGSAPLRRIAEKSEHNRGTAYDTLKRLIELGLVRYVDGKTHRYFTAEDPKKIRGILTRKEIAILETKKEVEGAISEFSTIAESVRYRPAMHYYEGSNGVLSILDDVLFTTKRLSPKMYRVYSSAKVRGLIAEVRPNYTKKRISLGIHVRAMAIGTGGKTFGLDERRWLQKQNAPTAYIFIYGNKVAYISANEHDELFGAIIEDTNIATSHRIIFDGLWNKLEKE